MGITATITTDHDGATLCSLDGPAGKITAYALRLGSGHPFVEIRMFRGNESEFLTRGGCQPFAHEFLTGGPGALVEALFKHYADLLELVAA